MRGEIDFLKANTIIQGVSKKKKPLNIHEYSLL